VDERLSHHISHADWLSTVLSSVELEDMAEALYGNYKKPEFLFVKLRGNLEWL